MAKNKTAGDDRRVGAVKARSQIKNSVTGTWTKRDDKTGKFMDVKADPKPFKGVRKSKGA
jgi:L-arabinose isomerase